MSRVEGDDENCKSMRFHSHPPNTGIARRRIPDLLALSVVVWLLFFGETEQNSSPAGYPSILLSPFGSVVWTTDSGTIGVRLLTSRSGSTRDG